MDQVRQETIVDGSGAVDVPSTLLWRREMLHRVGFVHRDIKPSNIMVNAYGSPVLTDFGVAEHVGTDPRSGRDGFRLMGAAGADPWYDAHPPTRTCGLGATLWTLLWVARPSRCPTVIIRLGRSRGAASGRVSRIDQPGVLILTAIDASSDESGS